MGKPWRCGCGGTEKKIEEGYKSPSYFGAIGITNYVADRTVVLSVVCAKCGRRVK